MNAKNLKVVTLSAAVGIGLGVTSALAAAAAASAATRYVSHPYLYKAHKDLLNAKFMLQKATHDCGGHRAVAIKKIDDAIEELRLAREYADSHPGEDPTPYPSH
jgi:hypothetical protein